VANSRPESGFGLQRGKVFPASHARSLLNPLRRFVQSPERTVAAIGIALPTLKSLAAQHGFHLAEKRGVGWQYVGFRPT